MITETRTSKAEPIAKIQLFWRPQEIGKDFELGPYIPVGDLIELNPNIRRIDIRDMICNVATREHLAPARKYLGQIIYQTPKPPSSIGEVALVTSILGKKTDGIHR